jgi:hypothetical protein
MERGAPEAARKLVTYLHAAFRFAMANTHAKRRFALSANPAAGVTRPPQSAPGERTLSAEEIRTL